MTRYIDRTRADRPEAEEPSPKVSELIAVAAPAAGRPWWQRPWMLPLAAVLVWFLWYELPPYFGLDPNRARIDVHNGYPVHYPLVLGHILFGTVAQVTAFVQVWPWLRRNHPRVHRWSGRLYVFGGALPAGILALSVVPFTPQPGRVGVAMAGLLWVGTTVMGYRMARGHRYAAHRRWMLYSFAIMTGINYWGLAIVTFGTRLLPQVSPNYFIEAARWVGWVVNLFIVQWWLERKPRRRTARATPSTSA